ARRERATERTAAPEATVAQAPAERAPADATPAVTPPTVAPLATTAAPAPVVDAPIATPTQTAETGLTDSGMSDEAKFAMGAGAVAILAIGAAFAMRRRKDPLDEPVAVDPYAPVSAPAPAAPVLSDAPAVTVRPARTPVAEPVMATAGAVESPYIAPTYEPVRHMAAPASSLEAMVAEQPTQANPFLTRKNRLRRANFLMHKGEAALRQSQPVSAEQPIAAQQGQTVTKEVRTQPVYDFGKASTGWRRLTPATT
ncbi:MAG: hypothetical protein ACO1NM_13485, partial [Sphingobium phenoxybenzoativorans]